MNPVLPEAALELGAVARRAFEGLGAVDIARRAEADPSVRERELAPALQSLGIGDIDPRRDEDALAAAAVLCEEAGRVALPFPVAGAPLRDADDHLPFALVPDGVARVDHGDAFPQWRVATVDGRTTVADSTGAALGSRLGPFVTDLTPSGPAADASTATAAAANPATVDDVARHLVLTAWQVLGTCDRAVELAVEHVNGRIQFGKPLAAFQAVQFQLADAAVAASGLRELALFTLWQLERAPGAALVDALALRTHALDVARPVLRTCQQLHGAAGVCDEYDISILCRHVQPVLRLPFGAERAAAELAAAVARSGFDGLFPHGHGAPVTAA
jgi:hypothetical protein